MPRRRWNRQSMTSFFPNVDSARSPIGLRKDWRMDTQFPAVNIAKDDDQFKINVAAPGFKKKDFHISAQKGFLIISAERKEMVEEKTDEYVHQEYDFHSFKREVRLPKDIDTKKISAKYKDGILEVSLPKLKKRAKGGQLVPVS